MGNEELAIKQYHVISLHNEPIDEVTYIVYGSFDDCLLVDPSGFENIAKTLAGLAKNPSYILLTHEHCDHIDAVNSARMKYGSKVICTSAADENIVDSRKNLSRYQELLVSSHGITNYSLPDPFECAPADITFDETYDFLWHDQQIYFRYTPGHSQGSCCIQFMDMIFTGDSLLRDNPVVTRLPGGNKQEYAEITEPYLRSLNRELKVLPGHGESFWLGDSRYLYS